MPTPIYRVVYVSAASELFSKSALLELLSKAREKNNRLGVTGLLLLLQRRGFHPVARG